MPFILCLTLAGCDAGPLAEHAAGATGPLYLLPESSHVGLCQSPINIKSWKATEASTHALAFDYKPSKQTILNTGHTIKLSYDEGSTATADGKVYDLRQFHFHTPSEHLVDGITYPLEMHLVHTQRDDPEAYLVVGVLLAEGRESNPFLASFLSAVPEETGDVTRPETLDVSDLQDEGWSAFFSYRGSLTTPPYTESVRWEVLQQIQHASAEQIENLQALEGNNARHVQPLEGRKVEVWLAHARAN